jgi:hypothetical protein
MGVVMVGSLRSKKNRQAFALAVFLGFGVRLAGPVRQQAGEIVKEKEETARHGLRFKHESPVLVQ